VALFHEKLLAIGRPVSFLKGAELVRQGEAARGAYFIRQGELDAAVALPGGGRLPVARLGEGDMFGEMALVERGVCTASVVARSNMDGLFVAREDFRAMVASREPVALALQREITRSLAARLRALNAKVREHPAAEDGSLLAASRSGRSPPGFEWRSFLPILPFFEGFDADALEELAAGCPAFEAERGAGLFGAGDAADACFLVVRGAVEIGQEKRRISIAGPGELVGYMAVIDGARHAASARIRESACLMEIAAPRFMELYNGDSGASVALQHAIHRSLLRALGRTNTQLARLICHAQLAAAGSEAEELEKVLRSQIVQSSSRTET